jgi:hypothetical protein
MNPTESEIAARIRPASQFARLALIALTAALLAIGR